ncbi:lysozyme inhibitor LprI family protein [Serratia proteamaculans]|uniref:lysozyme inhibitor LprI family protein n=1 Tax=Serratia proteamaculans TaxID=28151 RepID=UPI0024B95512|nr:lysozyme inhibitor LprI family protein [Serratia proteamaculans]
MKLKMLTAALVFTAAPALLSTAQAASQNTEKNALMKYHYSAVYTQCMDQQGGNTPGAAACIEAELKLWDTRLNKSYKESLKFKAAPEAWRQAQRDWLKFKDSQCMALVAAPHGSGDMLDSAMCELNMTLERTLQLESDTWPAA